MAALDWAQCPVVESIPGKVSGAWVFRGTRTPVAVVFENLEDGMTIDEVIEQFPVSRSHVKAVLGTTDRNLRYQQNLAGRKIAIIVLGNGRWRLMRSRLPTIGAAVAAAAP